MCNKTQTEDRKCRRYRAQIEQLADQPEIHVSESILRHVETCPSCQELLDEILAVQHLLDKAKWQTMPAGTLALCNRQAMKKLERQIRETPQAQALSLAQPDLTRWQKATIRMTRSGIGVAAGVAIVVSNMAATSGLNMVNDELKTLGDIHRQNHVVDWENPDQDSD